MMQSMVNDSLHPRAELLAKAYFDMEDGLGIAYRKSILASAMFTELRDDALEEIRMSLRNPTASRDWSRVLRRVRGKFDALEDALTDVTRAVNELDRAYYAADTGEVRA